jgi:hypothetical protein
MHIKVGNIEIIKAGKTYISTQHNDYFVDFDIVNYGQTFRIQRCAIIDTTFLVRRKVRKCSNKLN